MKDVRCQHIRDWAHGIVRAEAFEPFEQDQMFLHVATCDTCRGAVIALSLVEPTLLPPYTPMSCTDCRARLPAFVEAAGHAPGSEVAIYPEVWWHLLSCQDCAHEFIDLRAFARLIQTEAKIAHADLTPSVVRPIADRFITRFVLPREFLQVALPPSMSSRAAVFRGGHVEEHLLAREDVAPGFQVTLSVRQDSAEEWSVVVNSIPPLSGVVVLKLGELVQQASLDASGGALISSVPAGILLATDGPDVEVSIHPDPAHM